MLLLLKFSYHIYYLRYIKITGLWTWTLPYLTIFVFTFRFWSIYLSSKTIVGLTLCCWFRLRFRTCDLCQWCEWVFHIPHTCTVKWVCNACVTVVGCGCQYWFRGSYIVQQLPPQTKKNSIFKSNWEISHPLKRKAIPLNVPQLSSREPEPIPLPPLFGSEATTTRRVPRGRHQRQTTNTWCGFRQK